MDEKVDYVPRVLQGTPEEMLERKKEVMAERRSKLTPQQSIFINHYFEVNCDIRVAAERTGVKVAKAREWIESEGPVSDKIAERLQEMESKSKVTVADIEEALWTEATRLPQSTKDITVTHAARVSALNNLAKYKGMFDKGNASKGKQVVVNIDIGGNVESISGGEEEHE